jgi:hypothetical protein
MKTAAGEQSAVDSVLRPTARQRRHWGQVRLSALLMSLLVVGGCVSAPKYPENWTPGFPREKLFSKPDYRCPSIAGSYSDAGESSPDKDSHATVSLWRTLFAGKAIQDSVTIRDPEGGTLEIVAWKDGKPVGQKKLLLQKGSACDISDRNNSDGCYFCLNGLINAIIPSVDQSFRSCFPSIECENYNVLYRSEDNWLVLKRKEFRFYGYPLPPFMGAKFKTRWYRFRQMHSMTDTA